MINPRLPNVKNIERSSVKLTHAKRKLKIQKFAQTIIKKVTAYKIMLK